MSDNTFSVDLDTPEEITIPKYTAWIGRREYSLKPMKRVIMPEGVKEIGAEAFWMCEQLESINLPESLVTIGEEAFTGCKSLKELRLPAGLQEIGRCAFPWRSGLKTLTIPEGCNVKGGFGYPFLLNTVVHCGQDVFKSLPPKEKLALARTFLLHREEFSEEETAYLVKYAKTKRNDLFGVLTDPSAFDSKPRFSYRMAPEDVTALAELLSFCDKIDLDKLNKAIEKVTNEKNTAAVAMILDAKNKWYTPKQEERKENLETEKELGTKEKSLADWRQIFRLGAAEGGYSIGGYKGKETQLEIPAVIGGKPVVAIGKKAFTGSKLTEITLPSGLKSIGPSAFANCLKLRTVRLPDTLETIEDSAFSNCPWIKEIAFPNGLRTIGVSAFNNCERLVELDFPESLESIGALAFGLCTKLKKVTFRNENTVLGERAFIYCQGLENKDWMIVLQGVYFANMFDGGKVDLLIPETVKRIDSYVLSESSASLESVVISDSVVSIGTGCFRGLPNVKTITVPASVTEIGADCFTKCKKLTLKVTAGSYAEQYAKENNIPFVEE